MRVIHKCENSQQSVEMMRVLIFLVFRQQYADDMYLMISFAEARFVIEAMEFVGGRVCGGRCNGRNGSHYPHSSEEWENNFSSDSSYD